MDHQFAVRLLLGMIEIILVQNLARVGTLQLVANIVVLAVLVMAPEYWKRRA